MSHARLTLCSVLALSLAVPATAQAPAGRATSDSAVADSAKPKKSRFGGMMDKAKQVAANKAIKGAVKGAATNVACNAVPGAAVAAAASGNTTCQNTLMGGLVQKGMAAAAGGAASGAAATAAAKLGGTKGAALAGAISGVTGADVTGGTGLKGAAASMVGGKVSGLSQAVTAGMAARISQGATAGAGNAASMAAAQAAAAQMMQGGTLPNGAKAPSAADMAAAIAAMNAMNTAATGGKKVETIDFRELKGMLPVTVGGLKRTEATGEKNAAMGMQISTAEGTYSADDGRTITLKVTDIGALTGMAAMSTYAWTQTEVDRESDHEYEKSTTFKGYKALERYNTQGRSGDLSVLVGGRFVVEATGGNVDMKAIKAAVDGIDLRKLDGMKGKGVH